MRVCFSIVMFAIVLCPHGVRAEGADQCPAPTQATAVNLTHLFQEDWYEHPVWKQVEANFHKAMNSPQNFFASDVTELEAGARAMADRLRKGDTAMKSYVDLGWRLDSTQEYLIAPPSLREAIEKYNRRMLLLPEDQRIYPALKFENSETGTHKYYRIGIDPLPASGTGEVAQLKIGVVSHSEWEDEMAKGVMPISGDEFIIHEPGHLSEQSEALELTAAIREFYVKKVERRGGRNGLPFASRRVLTIAEYMSLPNLKLQSLARKGLPALFSATKPVQTLAENIDRLQKLSPEALRAEAEFMIENQERIFLRHGGALRDGINLRHRMRPSQLLKQTLLDLQGQRPRHGLIKIIEEDNVAMVRTTHHYQLGQIQLSLNGAEKLAQYSSDEIREFVVQRLARVQMALKRGVELKITPVQMYKEAALTPPEVGSPVYEYFKSFSTPGELLYVEFVRAADLKASTPK